jgi:hypothetical protein
MTNSGYIEMKARRDNLSAMVERYSCQLQAFPRHANGLTPDAVKASDAYRQAKANYAYAFGTLRRVNAVFVKVYKRDIKAERLFIKSRSA